MGCDIDTLVQVKRDGEWVNAPQPSGLDGSRNYALFSVLADCRNAGSGDERFTPIASPRGLPADRDSALKSFEHEFNHNVTWLSLAEILAYDWERPVKTVMYLRPEWYEEWDRNEPPGGWYEVYHNPIILSESEYKSNKEIGVQMKSDGYDNKYVIRVEGYWPTKAYMPDFVENVIPSMRALDPNPENVRLICAFNS